MSRKQDFERKCVETLAEKSIFEKTKYFIVDMDGTFYLDGNIIPGADGFLKKVSVLVLMVGMLRHGNT